MKHIKLTLFMFVFVSVHVAAEPSNKARFIPLLKSKLGTYKVVSANSGLCVNSDLSLINASNPSEGFKLGEQIVFGSLHNGTQTIQKPNFCFITSSLKYKNDGLDNGLRMSRCDDPINEKTIRQSIRFLPNDMLIYTLSSASVECKFKKVTQ